MKYSDEELRSAFNQWLDTGKSMDDTLNLTRSRWNHVQKQIKGAKRLKRIYQLTELHHCTIHQACHILANKENLNGNSLYRSILAYIDN